MRPDATEHSRIYRLRYKYPEIPEILRAVPDLHWRKCSTCGHEFLSDEQVVVSPPVFCPECRGDSEWMTAANKELHSHLEGKKGKKKAKK